MGPFFMTQSQNLGELPLSAEPGALFGNFSFGGSLVKPTGGFQNFRRQVGVLV